MSIFRLQHTTIPMPVGANDEARRFYGGVLGLPEKPVPPSLREDRIVWFAVSDDGDELHVLAEDGFQPSSNGQHLCLVVHDLESVRQALIDDNIEIGHEPDIHNRPRFSFRDPFGNKVEITEIHGDYMDASKGHSV
jgi:catechol 2,3-dioxygenase-like lactoylglutathione lyase family enzyme